MNSLLFDLMSYIGIILIFTAYSLNRITKLNQKVYNVLNMMGGIFLAIYSLHIGNLVFTVLNTVWSIIALTDLFKFNGRKFKSGHHI